MIINLISGPRNISTALMYSFAQRSDTEVADEPFYAVYLANTGAEHPGREAILQALPSCEQDVRDTLFANQRKPVLFIKNMAHHMEVLAHPLVEPATNVFLIRDPGQILSSYTEIIAKPGMRDIGIAYQYTLFEKLRTEGREPIVVDSSVLLQDPAAMLEQLCTRCGIPYEESMTHWPAGPKPYDGVWAPHWYSNVHRSTGFERKVNARRAAPEHLQQLYHEAWSYYEKLLPFALKA